MLKSIPKLLCCGYMILLFSTLHINGGKYICKDSSFCKFLDKKDNSCDVDPVLKLLCPIQCSGCRDNTGILYDLYSSNSNYYSLFNQPLF